MTAIPSEQKSAPVGDVREFYTQTDLKGRNWTRSLIEKFLGQPDESRPNPRYRNASPSRLYRLARVEQMEAKSEFQRAQERAESRRRKGKETAEKRRQALLTRVEKVLRDYRWQVSTTVRMVSTKRRLWALLVPNDSLLQIAAGAQRPLSGVVRRLDAYHIQERCL